MVLITEVRTTARAAAGHWAKIGEVAPRALEARGAMWMRRLREEAGLELLKTIVTARPTATTPWCEQTVPPAVARRADSLAVFSYRSLISSMPLAMHDLYNILGGAAKPRSPTESL